MIYWLINICSQIKWSFFKVTKIDSHLHIRQEIEAGDREDGKYL